MPNYSFKARNKQGEVTSGNMHADDEFELRQSLEREGLYLVEHKIKKQWFKASFFAVSSRVSKNEVTHFCQQFSVMINAGISLVTALESLKRQGSLKFKEVLNDVHQHVLVGNSLSEAMGKYPKVFPAFMCNMISVGEVSGKLDSVFMQVATYYEKDNTVKKKAKTAMVYPCILLALIFVVLVFMVLIILPSMKGIYNNSDSVPKFTKALFSISDFMVENISLLVVGFGLIVFLFISFIKKTKTGKKFVDLFKLRFPIIGKVTKSTITARFARGFCVLISSGTKIIDALEIMKKMLDNYIVEKKLQTAINKIKQGRRIASSLSESYIFNQVLIDMIAVGEDSGSLEEVLDSTADYFDLDVETTIQRATIALEPLLISFMGVIICGILLAVFLPILEMMNSY